MKLRIPPSDRDAVKDFLNLSTESIHHLLEALREAKPMLYISDLADHVNKKIGMNPDATRGIVRLLTRLYAARIKFEMTSVDFVKEFRSAVDEEDKLRPEPEKWEIIGTCLSDILSLDELLGVTSKALDVMIEHPNVFREARICTDIRPVFGPIPADPPSAVTLFHTLKIHYHEGNSHKEFFVALDSNDIRALQDVIHRATLKESSLKKWVKKLETHFMDIETQENG
jgi:hypothetical protein